METSPKNEGSYFSLLSSLVNWIIFLSRIFLKNKVPYVYFHRKMRNRPSCASRPSKKAIHFFRDGFFGEAYTHLIHTRALSTFRVL